MKNHIHLLKWATDYLDSIGCPSQQSETVQETPWSMVIRFLTANGDVYLKQTPPEIAIEPKIIQLLANQVKANVPDVIAINKDLHCFLMKGAGVTLRGYLKTDKEPNLLLEAVNQFTAIQRLSEHHLEAFFDLDVPDWRLEKLPKLFENLINRVEMLTDDGVTDKELKKLNELRPQFASECELLSEYMIPETLVQPDFNTNNMLFDPTTQKMTLIDLGEIVISHPFFSLHNFLLQATIHHEVKLYDQTYQKLQEACIKNWLDITSKDKLHEAFTLSKKIEIIYGALSVERLIKIIGVEAFQRFYANKPNRLAGTLRDYITCM